MILEFTAIIFDILPLKYCCRFLENVFSYDAGHLVAIVVVIWTFTTVLISYVIGKMEEKNYGISMRDIFFAEMNERQVIGLMLVFFGELFFLIIAVIGRWKITMVVISLFQFYLMVYVFLTICVKCNYTNVMKQLENEFRESLNGGLKQERKLLNQMISRLDYEKNDSVEELLRILTETASRQINNHLKNTGENKENFCDISCAITKKRKSPIFILL